MRMSDYAFICLKEFEGFCAEAYQCPGGVWTIGYGHTKGVKKGQRITEEDASRLLVKDVEYFEQFLAKEPYEEELTQGQWDALTDFLFNLGPGNFLSSTLRKKLLRDIDDSTIPDEFRRWNKSKGKVLPGLVKRREWEAQMFEWE
jgi:lysozyme